MKRVIAVLFLLVLFIIPAAADLIFEPDDNFYNSHSNECEYGPRQYIANGEDGYAIVYKSPVNNKRITSVKNQKVVSISWYYTDAKGQSWGLIEGSGWVNLSQFVVKYDTLSFYEDYNSEFKPFKGKLNDYEIDDNTLVWDYPGAEAAYSKLYDVDDTLEFLYTYTDKYGRLWGYIRYFKGTRDCWVCLSDPKNPNLPAMEINDDNLVEPADAKNGLPPIAIALILVAAVIAVTAVLIPLLFKKKNKVKEDESSPAP